MEAFSLLKYWRAGPPGTRLLSSSNTTTLLTAVSQPEENSSDSDVDNEAGDDGPFFDFEFTVPDEAEDGNHYNPKHNHNEEDEDDNIQESEGEREFKLVQMDDPTISLSPSHDLFFKGKLLHVEEEEEEEDPSSLKPNPKPHHFNSSFFKSATKFRVFMSALKKSKSSSSNAASSDSVLPNPTAQINPESSQKKLQQQQGEKDKKFFTVKFKVNEEISMKSLFTRDNSSKGDNNNNNKESSPEEKEKQRFSKEAMQKYLKIVKPLYVKVSRRYGDKLSFSGNLNDKAEPPPETAEKKHGTVKGDSGEGEGTSTKSKSQKMPAGLRVVCKQLGKSRSASSAVAAAPPPPAVSTKRCDDSLLQQQDGIQGAILHCKTSFNTSIGECQIPELPRCVSEPLHEK